MRGWKILLTGLLFVNIAMAETLEKEILLKDGSRIRGEIVSMQNGLYEIRTQSLGTIRLGSRQIHSITSVGPAPDASLAEPAAVSPSTIESIQSSITGSPGVMKSIMELQNDPQMQAVLSDPEIMRAVRNFDLDALAGNPKIQALMKNSRIREIQGEVGQ